MTEAQRKIILDALDGQVETYNRSKGKSKQPEFAPIYEKLITQVRETQAVVRGFAVNKEK